MIFLMSEKQWKKNKKKLVEPKDYIIMDATEDDDARMSAFTNVVTMDALNPPQKLVKLVNSDRTFDDEIISFDKIEKLEKEYFRGYMLKKAIMATVAGIIENGDINIFIVMRNKSFKCYKYKMIKTFEKLFPVDFTFIQIFSGDVSEYKKSLKRTFDYDEVMQLKKVLKQREKELEKYVKEKGKRKNKRYK